GGTPTASSAPPRLALAAHSQLPPQVPPLRSSVHTPRCRWGISGTDNIQAIAAGGYHTCALFPNGTVKCWGRNDQGQLGDGTTQSSSTPVQVGGSGTPLGGASAITGAFVHTCAILQPDRPGQCGGADD